MGIDKRMISGKRAEVTSEMALLSWRMIIIAAIIIVISITVGSVFVSKQDVRETESLLLARAAAECAAPDGKAPQSFDLNNCFSQDADLKQYFASVNVTSFESNFSYSSEWGMRAIKTDCEVAAEMEFENAPVCAQQRYYVLIENEGKLERGMMTVYAGISKTAQNIN